MSKQEFWITQGLDAYKTKPEHIADTLHVIEYSALTLAHTRIRELEAALEKLQNFITANANGGCLTCNDLAKEFKDA